VRSVLQEVLDRGAGMHYLFGMSNMSLSNKTEVADLGIKRCCLRPFQQYVNIH
jgi:hypothetical protein